MRRRALLFTAAVALLGLPANALAAPPLVGQWPLDASAPDGPEQVTADVSGNGLALRAPSGAMHLGPPARFGAGATLGTNVSPLRVTSPLLETPQVTLLAWIRQSGNPGTLRYIAGRGDDGSPTCGGSTYALYTGYPGKAGLHFYVRSGPTAAATFSAPASDAAVFDGQWHLVAGTYDGTAAQLYVDGAPVGPATPAAPPLRYALGGGTSLYVDGYPVEACALFANADDWPGSIDEVRVYDRALSASELGRLAAAGATAPDLVTDASLLPPPTSGGQVTPTEGVVPPPSGTPRPSSKVIRGAELHEAATSVSGAGRQAPARPMRAALDAARPQAIGAMKRGGQKSRISEPRPVKTMSAKEMREAKPDPAMRNRLRAMRFGLGMNVPVDAPGTIVEAVATLVVTKQRDEKLTTQTVVLPPAAGIGGPDLVAPVVIPVDQAATTATTSPDVVDAALSFMLTQISVTPASETDAEQVKRAQEQEQRIKEQLEKVAEASRAMFQAILSLGSTAADLHPPSPAWAGAKHKRPLDKAAKREQRAQTLERRRDAANRRATALTAPVVTELIGRIGAKAVPAASVSLTGCRTCRISAVAAR